MRQRISQSEPIVVRNREDLENLAKRQRSLRVRPAKVRISLELPGLEPNVRSQYERRLSRFYSECGCPWGAAFGLIVLAGYASAMITEIGPDLGWAVLPLGLLVFILGVGVGKALGLARAHTKMRRTIADLIRKGFTASGPTDIV